MKKDGRATRAVNVGVRNARVQLRLKNLRASNRKLVLRWVGQRRVWDDLDAAAWHDLVLGHTGTDTGER